MLSTNNIYTTIGKYFVNANDIIRCEASSNYTKFYFANKQPLLIAKTLSACANAINDDTFIRIHQSHLINKNFIDTINADGFLFLKDGSVCNFSRRKKREAKKMLCAS